MILKIEIGDWDGGNNSQYPKIIEFSLSDEETPFLETEGWGHGIGGSRSSLKSFISSQSFKTLNTKGSEWAYDIIETAFASGHSTHQIAARLKESYVGHEPTIPPHLEACLKYA